MTGNHCHCEIAEKLNLSLSLASHHLNVLTKSGLVTATRNQADARWVHFNINIQKLSWFRKEFLEFSNPNQIQERQSTCAPNLDPV
jgi:DNA-binding transcriptional ArsR family regulator